MEASGASVVKSAGRVFAVLEYFDEVKAPLSLKVVAAHFGYPPSSAIGLLKSMVVLGYLTYDTATRTYFPTTRVALLGTWVMESLFGEGRALELMEVLHRATSETILLALQNGAWAQYLHVIQSSLPIRYFVMPGTRRAVIRSGAGLALLAQKDEDDVRKLVARLNAQRRRPPEKIPAEDLLRSLGEIRRAGYVFSKNAVYPGVGAIVRPLPAAQDGRQLVVGVAGPLERLEAAEKRIHAAMRSAISRYKAEMGQTPARRLAR